MSNKISTATIGGLPVAYIRNLNVLSSGQTQSTQSGPCNCVESVTADAPLESSGGVNPVISLTGVIDAAHGGTGFSSAGTDAGWLLASDGAGNWEIVAPSSSSNTLLNGSGAPSAGDGNDGDFYIDIADPAAPVIYGPKAAGAWPSGVTMVGPQGEKGDDGPQGDDGPAGQMGLQGNAGAAGADGIDGPAGSPGIGIQLKGSLLLIADLGAVVNPQIGDCYVIEEDGFLYVFDDTSNNPPVPAGWFEVGAIQGPTGLQGVKGDAGAAGNPALTSAVPTGTFGGSSPARVPVITVNSSHQIENITEALITGVQPATHAASHASGGSDPVTIAISQVTNLQTELNNTVKKTGNETINGIKTFSSFPIVPVSTPTDSRSAVSKQYVDGQISTLNSQIAGKADDNSVVHIAGAETITGQKTFTVYAPKSTIPPTLPNHLVTRDYVNTSVAGNFASRLPSTYANDITGVPNTSGPLLPVAIQYKLTDFGAFVPKIDDTSNYTVLSSGKAYTSPLGRLTVGFAHNSRIYAPGQATRTVTRFSGPTVSGGAFVNGSICRGASIKAPDVTKDTTGTKGIFMHMWFKMDKDRADWWSAVPVNGGNSITTRQLIFGIASDKDPALNEISGSTTSQASDLQPAYAISITGTAALNDQKLCFDDYSSIFNSFKSDIVFLQNGDRSWHQLAMRVRPTSPTAATVDFFMDGVLVNTVTGATGLNQLHSSADGALIAVGGAVGSGLVWRASGIGSRFGAYDCSINQLYVDCADQIELRYPDSYVKTMYSIGLGIKDIET